MFKLNFEFGILFIHYQSLFIKNLKTRILIYTVSIVESFFYFVLEK